MSTSGSPGLLFVISAPSGAGKTSLVAALLTRDPRLRASVSHTTRPRRPMERDASDYYFVDREAFDAMRARGDFLEHALVFGNAYGTSRSAVEQQRHLGRDVLLEIDWQGARQIRATFPDAPTIFILPPSQAALSERLRKRGQDDESVIARRTREAEAEMSHHAEFDYLIVNDDFETAITDLAAVIQAERLRRARQVERHRDLIASLLSSRKPIQ